MTNAIINFFKANPITKKSKYLLKLKEHGYNKIDCKEIYDIYNTYNIDLLNIDTSVFYEKENDYFFFSTLLHILKRDNNFKFFPLFNKFSGRTLQSVLSGIYSCIYAGKDYTPIVELTKESNDVDIIEYCLLRDIDNYENYLGKGFNVSQHKMAHTVSKLISNKVNPEFIVDNNHIYASSLIILHPNNEKLTDKHFMMLKEFNSEQLKEIENGLDDDINVECYFDPKYTAKVMRKIRKRLVDEVVDNAVTVCKGQLEK